MYNCKTDLTKCEPELFFLDNGDIKEICKNCKRSFYYKEKNIILKDLRDK